MPSILEQRGLELNLWSPLHLGCREPWAAIREPRPQGPEPGPKLHRLGRLHRGGMPHPYVRPKRVGLLPYVNLTTDMDYIWKLLLTLIHENSQAFYCSTYVFDLCLALTYASQNQILAKGSATTSAKTRICVAMTAVSAASQTDATPSSLGETWRPVTWYGSDVVPYSLDGAVSQVKLECSGFWRGLWTLDPVSPPTSQTWRLGATRWLRLPSSVSRSRKCELFALRWFWSLVWTTLVH